MTFRKLALAVAGVSLAALAAAAPAWAEDKPAAEQKAGPQLGSFGFDAAGMDKTVEPGDDFYAFANGEWAKRTEIPSDKSNYGMFTALDDLSKDRVAKNWG